MKPSLLTAAVDGRPVSRRLIYLIALVALAAALTAVAPARAADTKAPHSIALLDSLTGGSTVSEGKVVYVDFWASWCVPCRRSFPWMTALMEKYGEQGLQIVAVNVDRDRETAGKFLADTPHAGLDIVYDPSGKIAKLYNLEAMPTSFVYGRDGTLQLSKEGFDPKETDSVEALIKKLLEEKKAQ